MEFGVFILAQQRGYHQSSQQVIRNAVEQTVTAEAEVRHRLVRDTSFQQLRPVPLAADDGRALRGYEGGSGSVPRSVCCRCTIRPAAGEIGFADTVSDGQAISIAVQHSTRMRFRRCRRWPSDTVSAKPISPSRRPDCSGSTQTGVPSRIRFVTPRNARP